jgi:3-deoxy-7-phosphoheptulonate synthase
VADRLAGDLLVVMRCYFEKPRTTLGWKGLINDPGLDGSFRVNDGISLAREFLLGVVQLGLATGCEFLDPITPQYFADLVAWGSIGARTAQSQINRQLASGLSMPVGVKNSPDGDVRAAVDAVAAAASPHIFPGIDDDGRAAVFATLGNEDCHVVLRGTATGPNYARASVASARQLLRESGLHETLLVDASHGNSSRDPDRQLEVVEDLAHRLAEDEPGIVGLMIESFIERGRQDLGDVETAPLKYGQSVTDPCISWEDTVRVLERLAESVNARRGRRAAASKPRTTR